MDGQTVTLPDSMADPLTGKAKSITHYRPVGALRKGQKGYWFHYFSMQEGVHQPVGNQYGQSWATGEGSPLQTVNDQWRTHDGAAAGAFWRPQPLTTRGVPIQVQGTPGTSEKVWINGPAVPQPAVLGEDFNSGMIKLNGSDANDGGEQAEDYRIYKRFYVPREGETYEQACQRIDETEGPVKVAPTDHGRFLRYGSIPGQTSKPVAQVLAYDLHVGPGYAFGDPEYWAYLLALADWKKSDPCYVEGKKYPEADKIAIPAGLDMSTVCVDPPAEAANVARRNDYAER